MRRGDLEAEPTGKPVEWDGIDAIPFEDGLVKRKDVYSDWSRSCARSACSTDYGLEVGAVRGAQRLQSGSKALLDQHLALAAAVGDGGTLWLRTRVRSRR